MKKNGYDPKNIALIEKDEQERRLNEKLEEIHRDEFPEHSQNPPRSAQSGKGNAPKRESPAKKTAPVTGSFRYSEDGSVEEIIEKYNNVTLEDMPLLPDAVSSRKPQRRVVPYEVKVLGQKEKRPEKSAEEVKSSPAGHRSRVRERFLKTGLKGFAPHEILEILLFYTIPRRDTKPVGRELIDKFGSIGGVFDAQSRELIQIPFVTRRAARLFRLIPAIAEFHESAGEKRIRPYEDYDKVMKEFIPMLRKNIDGKLRIAYFSDDLKLTGFSDIPITECRYTAETVRAAAKQILDAKCTDILLIHSHSGSCAPTESDIDFTGKMSNILSLMGIELMDHVIFGEPKPYSIRHNINMLSRR